MYANNDTSYTLFLQETLNSNNRSTDTTTNESQQAVVTHDFTARDASS